MTGPNKERDPEVEAQINELRSMYEFRDDEKVSDFLRKNDFLFGTLHEAHDEIEDLFPGEGGSTSVI